MPEIKYEGHPGKRGGKIVVVGDTVGPVVDSVSAQTEKGIKSRARKNLAIMPHEGDPEGSPIMSTERRDTEKFDGQMALDDYVEGEGIDGEIGQEAIEDTDNFDRDNGIA